MTVIQRTIQIISIAMFIATFAGVWFIYSELSDHSETVHEHIVDNVYDSSDINRDGEIDIVDLSILMSHFTEDNSVENLCQTLTQ